jgi:hypothetical protein
VFVNRTDVTAPVEGPEPGYVGSIVVVPSTTMNTLGLRRATLRNFAFALSPQQAQAAAGGDDLSVSLVPVTGANSVAQVLSYRQVYLATR